MPGIRVIAGQAKGRRLKLVPGDNTRPIMDRVKESLFNIVGAGIAEATFLDLFGGTGGVGIEALSRGAARATFIDSNRLAIKTIQDNLETVKFTKQATVIRGDALAFLRATPESGFDYIYIAPPQYVDLWTKALSLIDAQPAWLNPDGWAIAQIDPVEYSEPALQHLTLVDKRKYGSTLLCFYERPGE
ncbi:MAG TPA: 16S rRNA (guanine(966)-N(2))-methyltransferase RsmD [Anaerolineales bacterium]|nr:16S rRNA (guanine(966)-N(2))-methyltransferase RsmD [Anaerolineales bacterium]